MKTSNVTIELSEDEKRLLLELIESAERSVIQGLDHADIRSYKVLLRDRLDLLDSLKYKVQAGPMS
jgi:hypothetical protein